MQIKKGNSIIFEFTLKDQDNNPITDLTSATDIVFQLKVNKKDAIPVIEKTLLNGIVITDNSQGILEVSLNSNDTNIDTLNYWWGLKLTYSPTNKQEVYIKSSDNLDLEKLEVVQNVVL